MKTRRDKDVETKKEVLITMIDKDGPKHLVNYLLEDLVSSLMHKIFILEKKVNEKHTLVKRKGDTGKIKHSDIPDIINRRQNLKETYYSIADHYGVSSALIYYYANKHKVKGASKEKKSHGRRKLTKNQVREIRKMIKKGISKIEIASRFGVHNKTIYNIENNIAYTDVK